MQTHKLFVALAQWVGSYKRCAKSPETHSSWQDKQEARINAAVERYMPHGGGFDNGTELDLEKSTEEKLVFLTNFHHMTDSGMYDGWSDHTVTVKPSLAFGYVMTIGGKNRNDVKELIQQSFDHALSLVVDGEGRLVEPVDQNKGVVVGDAVPGVHYIVACRDSGLWTLATRTVFDKPADACDYMRGIHESRNAIVISGRFKGLRFDAAERFGKKDAS